MRAFHKQAMMKQKYMKTYLQGKVGWITVQENAFKQFLSTWMKQKHSPRTITWGKLIRNKEDGASAATSSTYELPQMILLWGFLTERPKIGLGDEDISSRYK